MFKTKRLLVAGIIAAVAFSHTACGSSYKGDSGAGATYDTGVYNDNGYYATDGMAVADEPADVTMEAAAPMEEASGAETAKADVVDTSKKLIKNVNLSIEALDFSSLIKNIEDKTAELGGYVEHSNIYGTEADGYRTASYVLRVPADKLGDFITYVDGESNVTSKSETVEDVTLQYVDLDSHVKALRAEQDSLMAMLEKAESIEDIIAIQGQLTNVRYEIESYESQLRTFDNQVNYSTVYLDIEEVTRETPPEKLAFGQEIKEGLKNSFYSLGKGFRNFAVGFITALPILVVVVVIIWFIVWIIRKIVRFCKKRSAKNAEKYAAKEAARQAKRDAKKAAKLAKKAAKKPVLPNPQVQDPQVQNPEAVNKEQ